MHVTYQLSILFAVVTNVAFGQSGAIKGQNAAKKLCALSGCKCEEAWTEKMFPGDAIKRLDGISAARCLLECSKDRTCRSVTFQNPLEDDYSSCTLNKDAASEITNKAIQSLVIREDPDSVHFEGVKCAVAIAKKNWKALQYKVCERREKLVKKGNVNEAQCDGTKTAVQQLDCACLNGMYRRQEDGKCVQKRKCGEIKKKQKCPENEEYVQKGECYEEDSCDDSGNVTSVCDHGCVCQIGYNRKNGKCVPEEDCHIKVKRQSFGCGEPAFEPSFRMSRIINGDVTAPHSWPWQAWLKMGCGASIYNERYLITAAHCFGRLERRSLAWLGMHRYRVMVPGGEKIGIVNVTRHPDYKGYTMSNDIAIAKLRRPMKLNRKKRPICMPNSRVAVGDEVVVTGWGTTEKKRTANFLKQVRVPVLSTTFCNNANHYDGDVIAKTQFCAGGNDKDACQGDSGGPLVYNRNGRYELQGIVSWGYGCNNPKYPGVYTIVNNYVDWIKKTVNNMG